MFRRYHRNLHVILALQTKQAAHRPHQPPAKLNQLPVQAQPPRQMCHKFWLPTMSKVNLTGRNKKFGNISLTDFILCLEVSEFVDDNASTTETDENKASEEIEDIEDEEVTDGVSSESEKTTNTTETIEVNCVFFGGK